MTKGQIERAVKVWQQRLGLDGWDVGVSWVKDPVTGIGCSDDADMTTWRASTYDRAVIYPSVEKFGSWPDDMTNRLVVHELLHLSTRDVDQVVASIEGQVHPDVYRMIDKRYDHEIEGLVDRLAYRLVELAGCA